MDSILAGVSTAELRKLLAATDSMTVHRALTAEISSRGEEAISAPVPRSEGSARADRSVRASVRTARRPPKKPRPIPKDAESRSSTTVSTPSSSEVTSLKSASDAVNPDEDSSGDDDEVFSVPTGAQSTAAQTQDLLKISAGATPSPQQSAELMNLMKEVTSQMARFSVSSESHDVVGKNENSPLARRNAMSKGARQKVLAANRIEGGARENIFRKASTSTLPSRATPPRDVSTAGIPKKGSNTLIAANSDPEYVRGLSTAAGIRSDDIAPEGEDGFKSGTHSVHGTLVNTEMLIRNCTKDVSQDAFSVIRAHSLDVTYPIAWNTTALSSGYSWSDRVQLPTKPTPGATAFDVDGEFDRIVGTRVTPWNIVLGPAHVERELKASEIDAYLNGRVPSLKSTSDSLRLHYNMTQITATALTSHLGRNRDRVDNAALYCYMALSAMQLHDYNQAGLIPAAVPPLAGALNIRDYAVPLVEVFIVQDMYKRPIVLEAPMLSADEIAILQGVASGFPRWTVPAPPAGRNSCHVLETLSAPPIPMVVHCNGAPVIPPISTIAESYWNLILKLAQHRTEMPDMLRGITRATSIINGRVRRRVQAPIHDVFETCALERYNIHMPTPLETNFMWPLLGIKVMAGNVGQFAEQEFAAIYSMNLGQYIRHGLRIAAAFSSCIGTVFHCHNIGGEEIDLAMNAATADGPLGLQMTTLAKTKDKASVPILFRLGISVLMKISPLKLAPSAFRCRMWSGYCTGIPHPLTMGAEWGATYSWHGPYQVDPLSMGYIYESFPPVWGYTGRAPVVDISRAITQTNRAGGITQWSDSRNCNGYEVMARSISGQIIVTHGLLAFNAVAQHFGWLAFNWGMYTIYMMADGDIHPFLSIATRPFVPTLYPGVSAVKIGTYRTYCWTAQEVMAPVISGVPVSDMAQLARGPMILNHAGIVLASLQPAPRNMTSGMAMPVAIGFESDEDDNYPFPSEKVYIKPGHPIQEPDSMKWRSEN